MCLARVAVVSRDRVARVSLFTAIALSLISYNLGGRVALVNRVVVVSRIRNADDIVAPDWLLLDAAERGKDR